MSEREVHVGNAERYLTSAEGSREQDRAPLRALLSIAHGVLALVHVATEIAEGVAYLKDAGHDATCSCRETGTHGHDEK
jgi:hypothetical protein